MSRRPDSKIQKMYKCMKVIKKVILLKFDLLPQAKNTIIDFHRIVNLNFIFPLYKIFLAGIINTSGFHLYKIAGGHKESYVCWQI